MIILIITYWVANFWIKWWSTKDPKPVLPLHTQFYTYLIKISRSQWHDFRVRWISEKCPDFRLLCVKLAEKTPPPPLLCFQESGSRNGEEKSPLHHTMPKMVTVYTWACSLTISYQFTNIMGFVIGYVMYLTWTGSGKQACSIPTSNSVPPSTTQHVFVGLTSLYITTECHHCWLQGELQLILFITTKPIKLYCCYHQPIKVDWIRCYDQQYFIVFQSTSILCVITI